MSEQSAVLESASAEVLGEAQVIIPEMDIARGPIVSMTAEQRKEYRTTGELPKPKTEEAATSSEQRASEAKPAGESETPQSKQEKPKVEPKPKQTAQERIAELEATIKKIEKGAGLEKPKAESAPAKPAPVVQQSTKPTPEDTNADGTPKYATHEDFVLALSDWRWEQREAERSVKEQQTAHTKAINDKIEEARNRYDNIDEVIQPVANEIYQDAAIPQVIKTMIGDSDVIVDLVYTLGSNKEELAKFVKMAKETPGKAIRYIALTESLIAQELEGKKTPAVEDPPAKPKTQAPKPPSEAGGRAATPPDSLQAALEGSAGKLNANLKAEFLRKDLARLKG